MNYKAQVTPKTSNFSHGGHVHNLLEKAYQPHAFGGRLYDAAKYAASAGIAQAGKHAAKVAGKYIANTAGNGINRLKNSIYPPASPFDSEECKPKGVMDHINDGVTSARNYASEQFKRLPESVQNGINKGINVTSDAISNAPSAIAAYGVKKAIDAAPGIAAHGVNLARELMNRHMRRR